MTMQGKSGCLVTWGHGGVGGMRVAKPLDLRGSICEHSIRKLTVNIAVTGSGSLLSAVMRAKGPSLLGRHILPRWLLPSNQKVTR